MELSRLQLFYPDIAFAKGNHKEQAQEEYVPEHMICHIIGGEVHLIEAAGTRLFRAGETFLLQRDHLVKCGSYPSPGGTPHRVLYFILRKEWLQEYAMQHGLSIGNAPHTLPPVLPLTAKPSLKGLFQSLLPFVEAGQALSEPMAQLKLQEAVMALLEQPEGLQAWLFDEAEQGKIDLEAFMRQHYMFNVPMSRFAALTGRSLSTFQRDFQKVFGMSASRWLLKRRLQAAHEALESGEKRPADIYLEVGFEDHSHFSRAFKQEYGYSPSAVKVKL